MARQTSKQGNGAMKEKPPTSPLRQILRRSRSAPPNPRTKLIEEHYRVDPNDKTVLPGVPKHEDDWARDAHDFFNLVVLVPLVILNIMNWDWDKLLSFKGTPEQAWTGEWFNTFYWFAQTYFVSDLLWILLLPSCVRSPMTIIQHHVATIIYMLVPLYFPDFRFMMAACLSVEVNTWFLIARRVFNKQGLPPWIINLPPYFSLRIKLISVCFYVTWIVIRCIIYPVLLVDFFHRYEERTKLYGTRLNLWAFVIPLHSIFVMLNLKWTYDLVMSKVRYWRRRARGCVKKDDTSKGL